MKKLVSISKLKKEADRLFSIYIRRKNSDWRDNATCYTCGKVAHWKELQNGHFVSRGKLNTRYLEDNCRVQCSGCNVFKKGNYTVYAERLIREKGPKEIARLNRLGNKTCQMKVVDYEKLIKKLKKLINNL